MSVERPVITEVVGFIGYGEAAAAFVQGWRGAIDVKVIAYDIKTDDPALGDDKQRDYAKFDVTGVENALALAAGADVALVVGKAKDGVRLGSRAGRRAVREGVDLGGLMAGLSSRIGGDGGGHPGAAGWSGDVPDVTALSGFIADLSATPRVG